LISGLLTLLEVTLLVLGVSLPIAKIEEFWIFSSEFSILSIAKDLITGSEILLGIVVISFGLIFPLIKIASRYTSSNFISNYNLHKFSMVDIFLISFLIFSSKVSSYFEMDLLIGFYFLLASVLLGYAQVIMNNNFISRQGEKNG
jgi:uncharacterized paraquat-inducible protein A